MSEFNRYSMFCENGMIKKIPFIGLPVKGTDKHILFKRGEMRLDKVSYDYYGSPDFAWLIMQANPEYGSIEYFIPDGVVLRIPYPLEDTLNQYVEGIKEYKKLHGDE
jgi:hypothetical protein